MVDGFELVQWALHTQPEPVRQWHQAVYRHDRKAIEYVPEITTPPRVNPLHLFAAAQPHSRMQPSRDVLSRLLDDGHALDQRDAYGWLPINYAAWFAWPRTLDLLLEAGSPVHNQEAPQPIDSAFMVMAHTDPLAMQRPHTCAKLLIMAGADPRLGIHTDPQYGGVTWLVWALERQEWQWAEYLWAGAGLRPSDRELAMLIATRGSPQALAWLLHKGVSLRVPPDHPAADLLALSAAHLDFDALATETGGSDTGRSRL